MFAVVRRYVVDKATAEDLLHDGFITLFTKIGEWRGEGVFDAWCRRIFVNTALSYLRKQNPLGVIDEDVGDLHSRRAGSAPPEVLDKIENDELKNAIDTLPEGYKMVLNLYAVEGFSHAEIAQMLGISETTSRSQYLRAKQRLAELLRQKGY